MNIQKKQNKRIKRNILIFQFYLKKITLIFKMKKNLFNISLLVILFFGNVFIANYNYYFILIYLCIFSYHNYIFYFFIKCGLSKNETIYFLITSLLLYFITYFFICDPNPFSIYFLYYTFNPCFIKAILIIIIHTSFLYHYKNYFVKTFINCKKKVSSFNFILDSYFLSDFINLIKIKVSLKFFLLILILFLVLEALIFVNRIKIWIYYNKKSKTLKRSYSKNTIFYIASNLFNIEDIIESYISEMKKLIEYLGEKNVIVSLVENGDSTDNTRKYLEIFQDYLNKRQIINNFSLTKEFEDPRNKEKTLLKLSPLRIQYYAKLRNKCLDFLYEQKGLDFDNVIVIFFNDIVFRYEDIINLLSTNNEDYDAVCGLDMYNHYFYDSWVSIDLDGNGLNPNFPYFKNKEAQDLVIYHKPVRVFSCWNGVIAFKASPLKNKTVRFRHKENITLPKHRLNIPIKHYFDSECTYFHIDLFSLGYTKKFINPDVRVTYTHYRYSEAKYFTPSIEIIFNYFKMYILNFFKKRNKNMSNYVDNTITLKPILNNWYLENKIDIK